MKRRIIYIVLLQLVCCSGFAQTYEEYKKRQRESYQAYKDRRAESLSAYRDSLNAAFADYMRREWPRHEVHLYIPVPQRPSPPEPTIKDPDDVPIPDTIPVADIPPMDTPPAPQPTPMVPDVEEPVSPSFEFLFYGTPCMLSFTEDMRFRLADIDETNVGTMWEALASDDRYITLVSECLVWKEKLHLNDWGYARLAAVATQAMLPNHPNEATLLQMYILTLSGYQVRLARFDNELALLLHSQDEICRFPYIELEDMNFYMPRRDLLGKSCTVFEGNFPNEQPFSVRIYEEPALDVRYGTERMLRSKRYPEVAIEYVGNRNLIDYYNDYPIMNTWGPYVSASLSARTKKQLYPVLRRAIEGKSEVDAANLLINFVQTAFEYQTDGEQFGYERPLFGDETLSYPYSDCEDRAILYAILMRELLGLEAVLLHYPEHLATAIRFTDDITGDCFMIGNQKYVVCDPTYIGADIGEAMPRYKQVRAEIIRITE